MRPSRTPGTSCRRTRARKSPAWWSTSCGGADQGPAPHAAFAQHALAGFGCHGLGEVKTLHFIAGVRGEKLELTLRFDAFGDHLELQAVGQPDDGDRDRRAVRIHGDVPDESAVDLQRVERKTL